MRGLLIPVPSGVPTPTDQATARASVKALKGKRVAIGQVGDAPYGYLVALLGKSGLSPRDVQWIPVGTDVSGRAIGVIGTGIDVCYPKENKKLYAKVLERGAIISELPTGSHPAPENFPVRNRVIAGMPLGVVGQSYKGGTLVTADEHPGRTVSPHTSHT